MLEKLEKLFKTYQWAIENEKIIITAAQGRIKSDEDKILERKKNIENLKETIEKNEKRLNDADARVVALVKDIEEFEKKVKENEDDTYKFLIKSNNLSIDAEQYFIQDLRDTIQTQQSDISKYQKDIKSNEDDIKECEKAINNINNRIKLYNKELQRIEQIKEYVNTLSKEQEDSLGFKALSFGLKIDTLSINLKNNAIKGKGPDDEEREEIFNDLIDAYEEIKEAVEELDKPEIKESVSEQKDDGLDENDEPDEIEEYTLTEDQRKDLTEFQKIMVPRIEEEIDVLKTGLQNGKYANEEEQKKWQTSLKEKYWELKNLFETLEKYSDGRDHRNEEKEEQPVEEVQQEEQPVEEAKEEKQPAEEAQQEEQPVEEVKEEKQPAEDIIEEEQSKGVNLEDLKGKINDRKDTYMIMGRKVLENTPEIGELQEQLDREPNNIEIREDAIATLQAYKESLIKLNTWAEEERALQDTIKNINDRDVKEYIQFMKEALKSCKELNEKFEKNKDAYNELENKLKDEIEKANQKENDPVDDIKENEEPVDGINEERLFDEAPQHSMPIPKGPIEKEIKEMQTSVPIGGMAQEDPSIKLSKNINDSIEELEAAKTFINSGYYKNLILSLKELQKVNPLDGVAIVEGLNDIARKVDRYLDHKAADGVNANVYKKLAAVQKTNEWITTALKNYDPKVNRVADYKTALDKYKAENKIDDKGKLPELHEDKDYQIVLETRQKTDPKINKKTVVAADECLCSIILKAKEKDRVDLIKMRKEFNVGLDVKLEVKQDNLQKEQNKGPKL